MTKHPIKKFSGAAGLILLAFSLSAFDDLECNQCDRVDFVTRGVGDAVEVNKASQIINPWPAHAKDRNLTFNGKRAGLAMQRYETDRSLTPRPLNPIKPSEMPLPDNALQAPQPQQ